MKNTRITPLVIGINGTQLNPELRFHLTRVQPLGIILFRKNITNKNQIINFINSIQDLVERKLLIGVDQEGGSVNRLASDMRAIPSPRALYNLPASDQRILIHEQAEQLAHLGINLNFAPVLDLTKENNASVIGNRSFSEKHKEVSHYAREVIEIHRLHGIATVAKHFPGLGGISFDPHYVAGILKATPSETEESLKPFLKAIQADVPGIMTSHALYPALDSKRIATFSSKINIHLLRTKLNFKGAIFTDCLEMKGAQFFSKVKELGYQALEQGNDALITSLNILKSSEFQIQLMHGCLNYAEKFPEKYEEKILKLTETLQVQRGLCKNYSVKKFDIFLNKIEKSFTIKKNFLFLPSNDLNIIECSSNTKSGIETPETKTLFSLTQGFLKKKKIKKHYVYRNEEPKFFIEQVIKKIGNNTSGLLLISFDGYQMQNFFSLCHELCPYFSSRWQIALNSERDIYEGFGNSIVTWGYNSSIEEALLNYFKKINLAKKDSF